MSDYELLPESPLGGVEIELEGFNITEVTDKSLVMVALPRDKFSDIESSIDKSCGLKLPEMENSTESKDSSITLWRLQKNQVLRGQPPACQRASSLPATARHLRTTPPLPPRGPQANQGKSDRQIPVVRKNRISRAANL